MKKMVLAIVGVMFSGLAYANSRHDPATIVDPSCRQNVHDQYDLGWRLTRRSVLYAGQCVSTTSRRPITILEEGQDKLIFANFYHHRKYWTAHWDKGDIPKVSFLTVYFDVGVPLMIAAHTELRFKFPKGLRLYSQVSGEVKVVKDISFDWESGVTEESGLSVLVGFGRNLPLVGRALSIQSRISENLVGDRLMQPIYEYKLPISAKSRKLLFLTSLKTANALALSTFFNTLDNNCTTQQFDILDSVLKSVNPARYSGIRPFRTNETLDPIAGPSRIALIRRGLIDPEQAPLSLALEFGYRETPLNH